MQAHKPNSVSNLSSIWSRHRWRDLSIYPPTLGEPPYISVGLHDVTAFEVYLKNALLQTHFHLRCISTNVIFCGTFSRHRRDSR